MQCNAMLSMMIIVLLNHIQSCITKYHDMHVKYEGEEVNFTLVDVFNIQIKFYAIVLTCYETMNAK